MTLPAAIPSLDEKISPIVVSLRSNARRFATPQEARAIEALQAVLDDQPPPAKPSPVVDALYSQSVPDVKAAEAMALPKAIKPTYRQPAAGKQITERAMREADYKQVDAHIMRDDVKVHGQTPQFVAPAFERVASEHAVVPSAPPAAVAALAAVVADIQKQTEILLQAARADAAQWCMKLAAADVAVQVGAQNKPAAAAVKVEQPPVADVMPFGAATLRLFCY